MAGELQETLHDLMVQYTEGEVLCDVQITSPSLSFGSYKKACHADKKMTAEHIHLARNRVSRLAIVEHMDELEEKFKKWKKDSDAYDNGMISILLDLVTRRGS